ncbi:MAG: 16S rRNA (cytidine(1402)-2'-O)-methyltransferase [Syntrophaceae bacterium]|nr:16S rRNA (cytidine(1402)-2'-O)-methyltransferase [Syntrophaceae bacterium]
MKKNNDFKKGELYIVATPIGNLEDISMRALRVMREADIIVAEDTRHTKAMLNAFKISTPLISLHEHNEKEKSALIIEKINTGKDIVYVTDAGTPCISDPGCFLISKAHDENIKVIPVPGPSAVITALSVSGFSADSFVYCGFLPSRENDRKKYLEVLKNEERTIVFYESPMRIMASLNNLHDVLGNRQIVLAREITKKFEEIRRGDISAIVDELADRKIKGEITIIIKGQKINAKTLSDQEIKEKISEIRIANNKLSLRDAVAAVASNTGVSKKRVYEIGIKLDKEKSN